MPISFKHFQENCFYMILTIVECSIYISIGNLNSFKMRTRKCSHSPRQQDWTAWSINKNTAVLKIMRIKFPLEIFEWICIAVRIMTDCSQLKLGSHLTFLIKWIEICDNTHMPGVA